MRRFPWRRRGWQHAYRCGGCGWYPPDPLSGKVYGRHDEKFIGHAALCPVELSRHIETAGQLADEWRLCALWMAVTTPLAEYLETRDRVLLAWSRALALRSEKLGCSLPVPDHVPDEWAVR